MRNRLTSFACGAFGLVLLCAGAATAAPAPQLGDVVAGPQATGTGFRLITENGSVAFTVPSDWPVVSVQSFPPVSVAAFQAPNPADQGTPHSTNAAVTIFHLDAEPARSARAAVGKPFGSATPKTSAYNGWTLYSQDVAQGPTTYTVLDGVREYPDLNLAVAVRLAWPHLGANAADYDAKMLATYHGLLDSVSGLKGPYTPARTEVVRRLSQ